MKNHKWLSVLALPALVAGCESTSTDVSPKVDGQIRDNLSRPLTPEEISKMGGASSQGGSSPAQPPAGKGSKPPATG